MSSENQSSSDNAEGSGTLIHQEQSEGTLNLDVGSTDTNKLHDPQLPSQSDSITNAEPDTSKGGILKGIKTFFAKEVEEVSNVPTVKITFHVHLPSLNYVEGYPVIIGNIEELGNWEEPIVKLKQLKSEREHMHSNHSHWYSDPISIQNDRFENEIRYRYAYFVPKPKPEEKSKGITSIFKKGDKSKDDEKDKGESVDKKKKGKDAEKDKIESVDKKKKGKDAENESSSKDSKKNKNELNMREDGNDLVNETAKTQANDTSTTEDPSAKDGQDSIEDQKNKETKSDKKHKDTRNKEEGDLYFEDEAQIIDTLENFQPDTFPEEHYSFLSVTMTAVIQLNVDNRSFDWLKLFEIARIIDPKFTFIDAIQELRYNNIDDRVKNFLKEFIKHAKPVVNLIKDLNIYSNIGRWLFSNCNSFETLLFVWMDVIDHTKDRDFHLLRHFRPRVDKLVSSSRATLLANQFSLIPEELCVEVAEIFKAKALLLLKHRSIEWDKNNSEAILQILKDPQLDWSKDEFLEAMGRVSESSKHNLLLTFPPLLNYWFDSRFKTLKTNKLPEICRNWYFHLIELINGSDLHDSNDSKFIFAIYKNLSNIFPIVGKYENIFNDMLKVTVDHVMNCAVSDILSVTPQIATLEKEISVSYGEMVKTMLRKSVHKIDNNLIKILLQVCGCDNEILDIQSVLSEDIVCSVMTNLEAKGDIVKDHTKLSTTILNLLNTFRFWRLIFNATGRVEKLYSHPYVKQVQRYIHEFAKVMIGEDITLRSLNEILKYDTDILYQFFNFSINNKEVISKDLIKKHRKDCHGYLLRMDQLRTFYDRFCPIDKVKDVQKFLDDITNLNNNLEYLALKDALSDNHWGIHKKNMNSSRRAHRIANSHEIGRS
ncbi:2070_t:CDS:2 [Funneliformis mosseae]|uniref:2070_t:CDS:1 n=1 Tax=Funneliformis mosseae TaxID=27381 RepID=A0A9N8ZIT1_FUNMO|nr:2070_t:CDS:2 [Funneliformis mosseae]